MGDKEKKDYPLQPCGAEFRTKGKFVGTTKNVDLLVAIAAIAQAYSDAHDKAERFCNLISGDDCKKVVFVRYDFYDFNYQSKGGGDYEITVELDVIWKCAQK